MKSILLALSMLWATAHVSAQQHALLMLQTKNRNRNAYYKVGDEISFRLGESKEKVSGVIMELRDSLIVFPGFKVSVHEIKSLYIDEKTKWWLRYKVEQIGLLGGAAYLVLDLLNNGELSSETLVISGTLIGAGFIAKLLIGNRIKIKGRTKLRVLNL